MIRFHRHPPKSCIAYAIYNYRVRCHCTCVIRWFFTVLLSLFDPDYKDDIEENQVVYI